MFTTFSSQCPEPAHGPPFHSINIHKLSHVSLHPCRFTQQHPTHVGPVCHHPCAAAIPTSEGFHGGPATAGVTDCCCYACTCVWGDGVWGDGVRWGGVRWGSVRWAVGSCYMLMAMSTTGTVCSTRHNSTIAYTIQTTYTPLNRTTHFDIPVGVTSS